MKNKADWLYIIFILTALLAVGAIGLMTYNVVKAKHAEHSTTISGRTLNAISSRSQEELNEFMVNEKGIEGVQVVRASLVKNERRAIWFSADNPDLQQAWNDYVKVRSPSSPPLFSATSQYNDRIARLFNGDFDCREYAKTLAFNYFPAPAAFTPWICSVSIPAGFDGGGDFVGFIALFLKEPPVGEEKERLAKETAILANRIFKRDMKLQENQERK